MRRYPKARVIVSAAIAVLVALPFAFAAALGGLLAEDLGGGSATVSSCDTDGFTASYATSGGLVTSVTVGGIADPGCEGGDLSVTLTNSSGTSLGSGGPQTVPTDGGTVDNSLTLSLVPQPTASQVARVHVAVTGP